MKRSVKLGIQIALIVVAVVLAILIYRSIMQPVKFQQEKAIRTERLVEKMKNIRTVQQAYKKAFNSYIATPDSLIMFLQNGEIPYVKMIGTVPDSLTEEEAVKLGIVSRETFTDNAFAILFPEETDKAAFLDKLFKVPFNKSGKTITMEAGFITKSGYQVPVFEARVPFEDLLENMDERLVVNEISAAEKYNRYPVIKVGSMTEAITEGNWE